MIITIARQCGCGAVRVGKLLAEKYGIPACLILDKDGNFYKTNMRGAYLDAFLYDYYKK